MIEGVDHIVILVNDLAAASSDYEKLGFTVTQGGSHADGRSHNALVPFSDGSYLELIAFPDGVPGDHFFGRAHGQEGLITYALLPGDIDKDIAAVRKRGLMIDGPLPGGRVRPDGQRVEWQTARVATFDLPFLCGDVTPRELRVPDGAAREHHNGIVGINGILIAVYDLEASVARYSALLGTEPNHGPPDPEGQAALFTVGHTQIVVIQPTQNEMFTYLEERGEGPYALILGATYPPEADPDRANTHGVRWLIVPA